MPGAENLGKDLIPAIGQAAQSAFSPSTAPALPPIIVVAGGTIIFAAKVLDIIFNGVDSSA